MSEFQHFIEESSAVTRYNLNIKLSTITKRSPWRSSTEAIRCAKRCCAAHGFGLSRRPQSTTAADIREGAEMSGEDQFDVPATRWDFLVERLNKIDNRLSALEEVRKHVATRM